MKSVRQQVENRSSEEAYEGTAIGQVLLKQICDPVMSPLMPIVTLMKFKFWDAYYKDEFGGPPRNDVLNQS